MACATIAAAGARARARPRRGVAAGAIARKVLDKLYGRVTIRGALVQMGTQKIDRANWSWDEVNNNPFFCPDAKAAAAMEDYLEGVRKSGSSVGAVVEIVAEGIPAGLGAPVYAKLDNELASALMSINAVKGVEIGDGFLTAAMTGEENADEMRHGNDGPVFLSNHAGGILGGISTGQPIVARFAVKPTSSILAPRRDGGPRRRGNRDRHQGPPRPLRRHPRRAGGRGDDGAGAGRPGPAASRADGDETLGGPNGVAAQLAPTHFGRCADRRDSYSFHMEQGFRLVLARHIFLSANIDMHASRCHWHSDIPSKKEEDNRQDDCCFEHWPFADLHFMRL